MFKDKESRVAISTGNSYDNMKQLALDVHKIDGSLGFVHETVHNYTKRELVVYMKATRTRFQKGDTESKSKLIEIANNYSDNAVHQPDPWFFNKRQELLDKWVLAQMDVLIDSIDTYYNTTDTQEIIKNIDLITMSDNNTSLNKQLVKMKDIFSNLDAGWQVEFFKLFATVKWEIQNEIRWNSDNAESLFILDNALTDIFKKEFALYSEDIKTKVQEYNNWNESSLTWQEIQQFIKLYGDLLQIWSLDKELFGWDWYSKIVNQDILSNYDVRRLQLLLKNTNHEQNNIRGAFIDNIVKERSKWKKKRIWEVMDESAYYEKGAVKFVYDQSLPVLMDILDIVEKRQIPLWTETVLNNAYSTELNTNNQVVLKYINALQKKLPKPTPPKSWTQSNDYLHELGLYRWRIEHLPEAEVERLLDYFEPKYKKSNKKEPIKVIVDWNNMEYIPFVFEGMSCIIVLKNWKKVKNPHKEIKKLYDIPQFMYNNLRYNSD